MSGVVVLGLLLGPEEAKTKVVVVAGTGYNGHF